jgi:hypothetical protein
LLCVLGLTPAFAQSQEYRFDHWTTDNGLPQNTVRSIVQTRDGYLWMTTFDGLARFDGVRFTVFDKGNSTGINSNRLVGLHEAGDGSLLIGTQGGGVTVYKNGSFTTYTTADGLPSQELSGIFFDLNGVPVINTSKGSVYLRGGKIVPAPPQSESKEMKLYLAPSGARVTIDAGGVKWVKDGRMIHYLIKPPMENDFRNVWLYEDSRGNLWLADGSNLYLLRDGQITHFPEAGGFVQRVRTRTAASGLPGLSGGSVAEKAETTFRPGSRMDALRSLARQTGYWNPRSMLSSVIVKARSGWPLRAGCIARANAS